MPRDREKYNAYMRQYMKDWHERRRAEAVEALGGRCARCPETEGLQFDHIDPATKTMTIAKMWTASEKRFQAELAKCQLLCEPHHLEKSLAERAQNSARGTHGTVSAYRYCGPPKCDACKAAKRETPSAANSIRQSTWLLTRELGVQFPRGARGREAGPGGPQVRHDPADLLGTGQGEGR